MAQIPRTKGRFEETRLTDNGDYRENAQHICFVPAFQAFSPEELRLADYQNEAALAPTAQATPQATPKGYGLVLFNNSRLQPPWAPSPFIPGTKRPDRPQNFRYGDKIIKFQVGTELPQTFSIHENIVSLTSEFVRLALKKEWKKGNELEIPLADDEPEVFEIYQTWVYSTQITLQDHHGYETLIKAYVLGDKLLDPHFKNAIIDSIIYQVRATGYFDLGLTTLVYSNTPPNSRLRRLLLDIYSYTGSEAWLDETELDEPVDGDFLKDLAVDLLPGRKMTRLREPPFMNIFSLGDRYHEPVETKGTSW